MSAKDLNRKYATDKFSDYLFLKSAAKNGNKLTGLSAFQCNVCLNLTSCALYMRAVLYFKFCRLIYLRGIINAYETPVKVKKLYL